MHLVAPLFTLASLLVLVLPVPGSQLYGAKRGRPQYSSLIPFPRVGRSGGTQYYGQKRGGKSGLIPFPRVGKRGGEAGAWEEPLLGREGEPWEARHLFTLLPRIGRSGQLVGQENFLGLAEGGQLSAPPSKRQSLIPFPRVGKRAGAADRDFHRRLLRSAPAGDFKRRIIKKNAFRRRILRSDDGLMRRITRSMEVTESPERLVVKRQSLIPFPRTGKRSGGELDQVYIYEGDEDEEEEVEPIVEQEISEEEAEDDDEEDEEDEEDLELREESLGLRAGMHRGEWRGRTEPGVADY